MGYRESSVPAGSYDKMCARSVGLDYLSGEQTLCSLFEAVRWVKVLDIACELLIGSKRYQNTDFKLQVDITPQLLRKAIGVDQRRLVPRNRHFSVFHRDS